LDRIAKVNDTFNFTVAAASESSRITAAFEPMMTKINSDIGEVLVRSSMKQSQKNRSATRITASENLARRLMDCGSGIGQTWKG
jgi:hypothetical protein